MLHGIDYFSGNGEPDLAGVDFVFRKVSEGHTYTDPNWEASRSRVLAAGIPFFCYHVLAPGDPAAQAQWFLSRGPVYAGTAIALDVESILNGGATADDIHAWQDYVRSKVLYRNPVGLYCSVDTWQRLTTDDPGDFLWVAAYSHPPGRAPILHPYVFHQYSTSFNTEDLDVGMFADVPTLRRWALRAPTPSGGSMTVPTLVTDPDVVNVGNEVNTEIVATDQVDTDTRGLEAKVDALTAVLGRIATKLGA